MVDKKAGVPDGPKYYLPAVNFIDLWLATLKGNPNISMEDFLDSIRPYFDTLEGAVDKKTGKRRWQNAEAVAKAEADGKPHPLTAYKVRSRMNALNKTISNKDKCPQFNGRMLPVPATSNVRKARVQHLVAEQARQEMIMGLLK
jgi:hypothetical protein